MKKQFLAISLGLFIAFTSCKDKDDTTPIEQNQDGVVTVSGDITANTKWTADKIYLLSGNVFVTNNATLEIEPGTIIKGDKATKGCLIITRGAKIMAEGTREKPIVFTSNMPAGARKEGDWGGIIILGKAKNNIGTDVPIEGISDDTLKGKHGGNDDDDNSGVLKFIRIEYAGVPLQPDNEINGITFGSVGRGTTVEYIQVYRSGDDAFEWFGGSVNAKYLLAISTWDDDFDTDNGFSGNIQFALAQRLTNTADVSGSNGFESDNNSGGTTATPQTSAVFSNVTILGPIDVLGAKNVNGNYQHAVQIRRNSAMSLFNSVIAGYTEGVFYDDAAGSSSSALTSGASVFANNLILGCNGKGNQIKASNTTALGLITPILTANNIFDPAVYASSVIKAPYKYSKDLVAGDKIGTPDFTVVAGSEAASGAAFSNAKVSGDFFEKVSFKGAFGTENWAAGWAHFDPQSLNYTSPGKVTGN